MAKVVSISSCWNGVSELPISICTPVICHVAFVVVATALAVCPTACFAWVNVSQPEFGENKYITSFLFKLKSKPAALYQSLGGFAINGVNLTKLQSYPEKNSFDSYFFLCDLDGHIDDPKVKKSLEELGLHCEDFHVLGVFEADKIREK